MRNQKLFIVGLLISILVIAITGCGKSSEQKTDVTSNRQISAAKQSVNKPEQVSLTISAAASLKNVMGDIQKLYIKEKPNIKFVFNFASSGSLQQQIEQGADVDVLMLAAVKQMNALKSENLLEDGTIKNIVKNEVVLIEPKGSTALKDFGGLLSGKIKKIALGEPKSVPAGQYAEQVLTKLNILSKIKSKIAYGQDAEQVLSWVETGNADAGIVYSTDAEGSDNVKVVAKAPDGSHDDIIYPAAIIKASKHIDAAKDFLNFVAGDKAKAVFKKYGFVPVTD